jgi:hypothetical protein
MHAGLAGGLIISLIWMLILRYSAGLLAWLVIICANLSFVAVTLLAFTKALTASSQAARQCRVSEKRVQRMHASFLLRAKRGSGAHAQPNLIRNVTRLT